MNKPYLSVIIPVTDGRQQNLNLVLTSLECQTLPRDQFEVILVSDGGQDSFDSTLAMHKSLQPTFIWQPKHDPLLYGTPKQTMPPRNRGARNAKFPFYVFLDSDVVLHPKALEYYAEDMAKNSDRVVCGIYHWLHPMRVSTMDIKTRIQDVLDERLLKLPTPNPQTHNIARDMRLAMFNEQDHTFVYRVLTFQEWFDALSPSEQNAPDEELNEAYQKTAGAYRKQKYPKWLGMYSGNICWNARDFWKIGGYAAWLAAGAHDDGESGLAAMCAGVGLSFDVRIVGGHLYHARNVERIAELWKREIPMINRYFHLEQFADIGDDVRDDTPRSQWDLDADGLPKLEEMSAQMLREMGVADVPRQGIGADESAGFRGM